MLYCYATDVFVSYHSSAYVLTHNLLAKNTAHNQQKNADTRHWQVGSSWQVANAGAYKKLTSTVKKDGVSSASLDVHGPLKRDGLLNLKTSRKPVTG